MGICQTEKIDISYFIHKELKYKKIPIGKINQSTIKNHNNKYKPLNSTSINNVQFNNKRNSNSFYKFKNIPPRDSKNDIQNTINNISFSKNFNKKSLIYFSPKRKNSHALTNLPTVKRNINFSNFENYKENEKSPIDNNRAKIHKDIKNKIKAKSINFVNDKPQYINKKIINDEDDTDKILLNLDEVIKNKNNKEINNSLILSFDDEKKEEDLQLYYLNEFHFNSENKYSTEKDFDSLIQSPIFKNKINFTNLLLLLPERQWYKELIELSDLIKMNRINKNGDPSFFNDYLNKFIKIYNHFNHLVWTLSYFYSNSLLYNKSSLFKKEKLNLPAHNSLEWIKGFEWKGLHIKVLTIENAKKLIHEVKSLKYALFDYLQLFNNKNNNKNIDYNNLLSNEIIFPFMSYAYVGGIILYVSVEIKKLLYEENFLSSNTNMKEEINLEKMRKSIIRQSLRLSIKFDNYDYNEDDNFDNISFGENILNEEINLSNYSKDDLENSKILKKIKENNLLKIFDDSNSNNNKGKKFKFILINIFSLLPRLFKDNDKAIYHKLNQLNCIDIKNEFESPRYRNLTKINNLDKKNEMEIISKLIRIKATKDNIGIYKNTIDNINYKIIYDNNKKGNKINEQVTKFFVQFPLIQNSELSRLLITEYLNVGNLNVILNKYNTENTQEIPDRNIIIFKTTFQVKMKYSIIDYNKEQLFPKSCEDYISYLKEVCRKMSDNSYKIRNIDNLFDFCEKFGLNKTFLPFCLEFIQDEYLRNLIQIYLYISLIKKFYNYHEGQTLLMKLAIFERSKDESIINSSDYIKNNNIIEMQKYFIVNIIKLIFLPLESLEESEPSEPFAKKFFQNISFFIFLKVLKLKNFQKYLNFESNLSQLEINQILITFNEISRNNSFLFIDTLEKMINFRMNPFIKYRASIDINNLKNLNKDNIYIFSPKIETFVEFSSITSYIFTYFAKETPPTLDKEKIFDFNPILSKIDLGNYYPNLIFKNPINYDKNNSLILSTNHYYIYNIEIMNKFCYLLEQIFDGVISYNGEKELMLGKSYICSLLISIFCNNNVNESKEILIKIKEILKYQYLFSFPQCSVISLLEAMISIEDISYAEKLYSKSLFLSLLNMGNIKTQTCKIHQFLMFPLFQLSQITGLYNNHYLNEYLNELNYIIDKKILNNVKSEKRNLGYYKFPYEPSLLSFSDRKINKDFLKDENFKIFICNVIIDYFYSVDNLLFDENFLLLNKIDIKEEKGNEEDIHYLFNKNNKNNKNKILLNETNIFNKYISEYLLDEMSYQKYAPSNIIISFGQNNYNQTGQEKNDLITPPRLIYSLLNKKIKKIFSGFDYNFIIDENNKIYSWGLNTEGQCGILNKEIIQIPSEVKINELENEEIIIDITCGNNFTYFLSNKNKVYLCGYNILKNEKVFIAKRIQFSFEKEKIIQIKIGEKFCLILTGLGNVYSFGEGEKGQLGQLINKGNNYEPKQVINIRNIKLISCGYNHCFAIGKNNIIFSWGCNEYGQIGIKEIGNIFIPKKIILNYEIDNIFCGKNYSIFHTDKKEIFVCGNNNKGQLGIEAEAYSENNKNNNYIINPTQVDQFYKLEIIKVACGEKSCIAMVKDLTTKIINIWSWGSNKEGQLGFGNDIENSKPKPIPSLLEYINHYPKDITSGKNHCLILLERKDEIKIDNNKIIKDLIIKYNKF